MKPLTLRLKNFGPYIDETIDFNKFEDSSLFLISGKTGSGKTTIFDGMSYALFGESSGKLRQGKEMRSTFADPSEPTEVQLVFSHGVHTYEITRKPEQELFKKRGDGTRTQSAKISLVVIDYDGKELREYTKRREVDSFIQELLHLDATQFAQIVLLPQGEFRTFLIANSNDKEKVLRNLFSTQLYQTLNERLKLQLKSVDKEIETTQQTIKLKIDQLYWEDQPAEDETIEGQLTKLIEQQAIMKQRQMDVKAELAFLQEQKQGKEQEKYTVEELLHDFAKKEQLTKQKFELDEATDLIEKLRKEEEQLTWVKNHQHLIEKIDEKTRLITTYDKELQTNRSEQQDQQHSIQQWEKAYQENNNRTEAIEQIKAEISRLQFQLPLYEEKEKLTAEKQEQTIIYKKLIQKLTEAKGKQTELEQSYQKEQEIIQQQSTVEKEHLEIERSQEQWQIFNDNWNKLQQLEKRKIERKQQITTVQSDLQQEELTKESLNERVKQQKSQWAKMQISRLSLFLEEGEPCPVCGSLEHPKQKEHQAFSLEEIQQTENQLNEAEQAVKKQEAAVAALKARIIQIKLAEQELLQELKTQNNKVNTLHDQLKAKKSFNMCEEVTTDELNRVTEHLNTELTKIEEKFTRIELAKTKLSELEKAVKHAQAAITEQESNAAEKQQELTAVETKLKTISEQLTNQHASLTEITAKKDQLEQQVKEWEAQRQEVEQQLKQLKENELLLKNSEEHFNKEKAANQKEQRVLTEQLAAAIEASKFDFDELVLRHLLNEVPKIETIKEKLRSFDKKKDQLMFQLVELDQKLKDKEPPEITAINTEISELNNIISAKESVYYQEQEKIQSNRNIQKQVNELIDSIAKQWEKVTALHQLTATVNGDNPRKISLERYVLQTYLEKVLIVANQRLGLLTKNRYQFELNEESGSYKNQTGLEINIYDDNSGSSRSAHTLSGGESFIAALALALSLAEVIQEQAGGVLIEALFIDEGFGSLDEEALEMAMEALETIENEGRMIGIISHVSELKARIPQQLQIRTNGNGQSQLTYQTA